MGSERDPPRSADRSGAPPPLTEAVHPGSRGIDRLDSRGVVEVMHRVDEDAYRAVGAAQGAIAAVVDAVVGAWQRGGRLIYIGAGTSGRLGVLDAAECPPTFGSPPSQVVGLIAGGDAALRRSVEGAEDRLEDGAAAIAALDTDGRDLVCGIAASGSTPYVLGALVEARRRGAATALVTCNPVSSPTGERPPPADHLVELLCGPEVLAGSTRLKAGTATKLALNTISTAAFIRSGKVYDNLMVDLRPLNQKLRRRAAGLVERLGGVGPQRARELLEAAGDEVKLAIVMARRSASAETARQLLEAAGGILRRVIEPEGATAPPTPGRSGPEPAVAPGG